MKAKSNKGALVLFSGGLDSTTCLFFALERHREVTAISFDYSQRHKIEILKAKKITSLLKLPHRVIRIDPNIFKNTSLVNKEIKVPKNFSSNEKIPNTYVPGRNILFLSYATSIAEGLGYESIYIGVNALDYSGYPDCRPNFIKAFQKAITIGTKSGNEKKRIQIKTPLLHLSKKEIVIMAKKLKVPFGLTHSCYDPIKGKPCGKCDSCLLRKKGFMEAGVIDK
ncbi:MAG TPA: 7-cyano-7-deazaguanine synthase QueC [Leptospiraceae bacterium]|nr:7-cyano-7-deazaguanine synthase QueC [Leptospiraceae bacterium]HMW05172.1 7-cyano-7-deazaguanine synthase QueC [Leptospiraceae bacterium]HMX32517.1 7-cyano-7-deazaguanine synthase QueC [Leptospiraceae bacterium]HMY32511.1 7-cyano-7-deazaguanine synthase QueC [Leptospiraceae bacterium]HMZ63450.1 7-cyano-7-deazaguanine synthase QueC [Leptospiraceae bacterium]